MKAYTWWLIGSAVVLTIVLALTGALSWSSLGNNLLVGLICALLTATVFTHVIEKDRRQLDGLWASEAIFLETVDVGNMVRQAAEFLIADYPPGVEAEEQWAKIAKSFTTKRQRLGPLIPRDMLAGVVALEGELNRADFVTARGEETRKAYAQQVVGIWNRYHSLMNRMLLPGDHDIRKDLMPEPPALAKARERFNLDELGRDRTEAAATEALLKEAKRKK